VLVVCVLPLVLCFFLSHHIAFLITFPSDDSHCTLQSCLFAITINAARSPISRRCLTVADRAKAAPRCRTHGRSQPNRSAEIICLAPRSGNVVVSRYEADDRTADASALARI
jgi:hypothetical protein